MEKNVKLKSTVGKAAGDKAILIQSTCEQL